MRTLLSFLFILGLTTAVPLTALAKEAIPPGAPASFADLAERLSPAVVNVSSTPKQAEPEDMPGFDIPQFPDGSPFQDFFDEFLERHGGRGEPEDSLPPASLGSGFVIDAENGYIVTNNHVVRDAQEVRVTFHDDSTMEAEVIGMDEKTDIAVLKVDTKKKLTEVEFGNSEKMRVGDWIFAIGNPFGLGGTVTAGIVSAQQRDINAGPYDDFIQTDASINRGNSGGPMFNLSGDVIGINTAIFSPSGGSVGIGFAIPSNLAQPIIRQLIEYGRTRRGWLGVKIQTVTDEIAESLELDKARGALVASVTEGSPAEEAKLKVGDVIIEFDGKEVSEMRALPRIVAETPIDKKVTLKYWRDGKTRKAKVKIGELEKAEEEGLVDTGEKQPPKDALKSSVTIDSVGLSVGKLSGKARETYGVPDDVEGVLVTETERRSEAAEKGLMEGDVIVEINQTPVSDPKEAKEIVEEAVEDKRTSILLLVNREGDVRFVALRLEDEKKD